MKSNKQKQTVKKMSKDDNDAVKNKVKKVNQDSKINLKSKKFWENVYEDEGDDIEKFMR